MYINFITFFLIQFFFDYGYSVMVIRLWLFFIISFLEIYYKNELKIKSL